MQIRLPQHPQLVDSNTVIKFNREYLMSNETEVIEEEIPEQPACDGFLDS
jgi:hypothetical protein